MKKIIYLIFFISFYVQADSKISVNELTSICQKMSESSSVFMEYRQADEPYSKVNDFINMTRLKGPMKETMLKMAEFAYEIPVYTNKTEKQKAIDNYKSEILLSCMIRFMDEVDKNKK